VELEDLSDAELAELETEFRHAARKEARETVAAEKSRLAAVTAKKKALRKTG